MILERFPEIQKLPPHELEQLRAELDELLFGPPDDIVTDPAILKLLEERHAEYLKDPRLARPADEVMTRLRARLHGGAPVDVAHAIGCLYRDFPDEPRRPTAEWMEELRGGERN